MANDPHGNKARSLAEPEPWTRSQSAGFLATLAGAPKIAKARQDASAIARALKERRFEQALAMLEAASNEVATLREDFSHETLLHKACEAPDLACVQKLLAMGADPHACRPPGPGRPTPGPTPMARAARSGSAECIQALIQARPNQIDQFFQAGAWGKNPALDAASLGHDRALQAIAKASPGALLGSEQSGMTAAMLACHGGHVECLETLWNAHGPEPFGALDQIGRGALGIAASAASVECVEWLARKAQDLLDSKTDARHAKALFAGRASSHPLALAAQKNVAIFDRLAPIALRLEAPSSRPLLLKLCAERAKAGSPVQARIQFWGQWSESLNEAKARDDLGSKLGAMRERAKPRPSAQLAALAQKIRAQISAPEASARQAKISLPRKPGD